MKNQRGEITTILTVISLGIMLAGIVVGNLAVKKQTSTQSKAGLISDPENNNFNPRTEEVFKKPEENYFPDPEEIKKPPKANTPELYNLTQAPTQIPPASAATAIPPQNTPIPPKDIPTGTVPLPGHSKIDCGGVGNQCNPATDNPQICGNDGCLHAAVGRPTQAPKLIPPPGLTAAPLPGRNLGACGGSWYQCNQGEFGCGNDGCDNIKLGRPFEQPVPTPPGTIITPIPGRDDLQCHGRYYQCVKGTPDCATDGCNDRLLQRGKFAIAPISTPSPGSKPLNPVPSLTLYPSESFDKDKCIKKDYPVCGKTNTSTYLVLNCDDKFYEEGVGPESNFLYGPFTSQKDACDSLEKRVGPFTPSPTSALKGRPDKNESKLVVPIPSIQSPAFASVNDWAKVQKLAVEGKYDAKQISAWVHEAAKYYYPGIQFRFCDPGKGECDFKL
ncbi:MAG: hypothetical protein HY515_03680 [Candidatus Aenigmarchaeota archaeon]|nr:hypothetical protein [Candidatus Aenigmarchaeota archaeon]